LAVIVVISPSLELGGSSKDHAMTVFTSHDTLVVKELVHHLCGLIYLSLLTRVDPAFRSSTARLAHPEH
jgi:hypothetical protein